MVQYLDNPGCTYLVIEDPWPGHKQGADRRKTTGYFEFMSAWIFYMLGKTANPSVIYTVDTRKVVIAELPEGTDITPILGAHHWHKFLEPCTHPNRVSYVFEYNYKNKGRPEEHNWYENFISEGREPPERVRDKFPVKHPYPPPSWASPGAGCSDIALRLPPTRVKTPTPPPTPAPQPSPTPVEQVQNFQEPKFKLNQDPYEEEESALSIMRRSLSSEDVKPSIKADQEQVSEAPNEYHTQERDDARPEVKPEAEDISPELRAALKDYENKQRAESNSQVKSEQDGKHFFRYIGVGGSKLISRIVEPISRELQEALEAYERSKGETRASTIHTPTSATVKPEPVDSTPPTTTKRVMPKAPFPWLNRRPREEDGTGNESSKRAKR
ncbi:hypothetical protein EIP91_011134 [Steccherinum ochraceum]|uniref:Uncharacterized protein n=1 Tax=Steccherinum ochraceum TaxID=92696 RepID=A0A4R0RUV6_9APHY|nr:hypothetical protein EIP91_011134 [Steccherinum ochraceum]